ncbi:MAG: TRL domain-containing protein [Candidatus Cloacimonetes bacterium]|nr:TRL domain-containing protein [Candidatus Cloacimonadota bacterium]
MKTKVLILSALLLIMLLAACTINIPIAATSNPLGQKTGVYTQVGYLGFLPMMNDEDCIAKAAQNGGITKISTVTFNSTWLVFMTKYETKVTGE